MAGRLEKFTGSLRSRKRVVSGSVPDAQARARRRGIGRGVFVFCVLFATVVPIVFVADAVSYVPLVTVVLFAAFDVAYLFALSKAISFDLAFGGAMGEGPGGPGGPGSSGEIVCERGSEANLVVRFRNTGVLVFPRVEVGFFVTDLFGGYASHVVHSTTLLPREARELPIDARFAHLGHYRVGVSEVVVYDLIGFLSKTLERPFERPVTVMPRVMDLQRVPVSNASLRESQTATKPIVTDDMDYAGVREYRFGDPLKTVHWKLSGRVPDGTMYTRLFEVFGNPGLEVIIDPVAPAYGTEDLMCVFDGLMESALSVNLFAREAGMDAELVFIGRDRAPASTQIADIHHVDALVEQARNVEPVSDSLDPDVALRLLEREGASTRGMNNVAFCTSRLTPQVVATLGMIHMRRRHAMLFLVVPRSLEGDERLKFLAPLRELEATAIPYYLVEPTDGATEVVGL